MYKLTHDFLTGVTCPIIKELDWILA
jgi:hypothetical protein